MPAEENLAYTQFLVPKALEGKLPAFLAELEDRGPELGVTDVQIRLATLEEVFLSIARKVRRGGRRGGREALPSSSGREVPAGRGGLAPVETQGVESLPGALPSAAAGLGWARLGVPGRVDRACAAVAQAELDAAIALGQPPVEVHLADGGKLLVPVGAKFATCEDTGIHYDITWAQDDSGSLQVRPCRRALPCACSSCGRMACVAALGALAHSQRQPRHFGIISAVWLPSLPGAAMDPC